MKKYILACSLIACTFLANSQSKILDKVIAKVGGEFILLSDVESQFAYIIQSGQSVQEDDKCQILEGIIAQKLMVYQAKVDSLIVSDVEVEAQLSYRFDNVLQQMNGDEAFFKEYYGASVQEMKDRMRDDQKQQILAERMQSSLINKVRITPDEVKKFYASIPSDSLPYLNAEVEVGELVIEPQINNVESKRSLDQINDLLERLKAGEDFGELAKAYSQDPGSAPNGGDLGFAKRGIFAPEFEAAAFSLEENEISGAVETEFGFHIIQNLKRRGNYVNARHILIKPNITLADLEKAKSLADSVRTLILNDSISFDYAVRKYSLDKIPSYSNNGKMKNPTTGNNFFETADLTPDVYFATEELDVAGISEPLEMTLPTGEIVYRLIQLQSKSNPHKANLQEDYDRIQKFAKESKKNIYLSEWLAKKYDDTYIIVDPVYNYCPNLEKWVNE